MPRLRPSDRTRAILCVAAAGVLAAPAARAQEYTSTAFDSSGAESTTAYGINAAGQIVGS
jgi:hypothetical protein